MMCVGRLVTNGNTIITMTIGRVSRLGTFRVATSPQGSSIPTTAGSPITPVKLAPGWKVVRVLSGSSPTIKTALTTAAKQAKNREFYDLLHNEGAITRIAAFPQKMPVKGPNYEANGFRCCC